MAEFSKIEWTHHTFNGWIGCTKLSQACDNCYAERFGYRQHVYWGKGKPRRRTSAGSWQKPQRWNREAEQSGERLRVFASSLADVFDTEVAEEWRFDLFKLIDATPHLDWLVLTKRSKPALTRLSDPEWWRKAIGRVPDGLMLPQIWYGNTVENQAMMDARWRWMKDTPAAVKFLSMEPLFEDVRLPTDFLALGKRAWVITGGESGPKARPSETAWFRSLRDQCVVAGVPHHFKQFGDWLPVDSGHPGLKGPGFGKFDHCRVHADGDHVLVGKHEAGRMLDGREWDELPEGPFHRPAAQARFL